MPIVPDPNDIRPRRISDAVVSRARARAALHASLDRLDRATQRLTDTWLRFASEFPRRGASR
jgi:hypothetical protein